MIRIVIGLILMLISFAIGIYVEFAPFDYQGPRFWYNWYHGLFFWKEELFGLILLMTGAFFIGLGCSDE